MKVLVVFVIALGGLVRSLPAQKENVVWFPNPTGDGTMIPAQMTPNPGARQGTIEDIHFELYTKSNPDEHHELILDDLGSIDNSHFDVDHDVKVLAHGFGGAPNHTFPWELMKAYMNDTRNPTPYNVILIDWSVMTASPDYPTAVANAQICSQHTANLLKYLVDNGKTAWSKVHLIGYSLGGQLVGQIGNRVQQFGNGAMVEKITALDPALPFFDVAVDANRTTPDDAKFVEVIHTAANGFLGFWDPCGHVDWYPNGGRYQPGCGVDVSGSCAHGRAPATYTESVGATGTGEFWGRPCASYEDYTSGACDSSPAEKMGWTASTTARGVHFLTTYGAHPFAQGPLTK